MSSSASESALGDDAEHSGSASSSLELNAVDDGQQSSGSDSAVRDDEVVDVRKSADEDDDEDDDDVKSDDEEEAGPVTACSELFAYADFWDWILMFFGTLGAIANGLALPSFSLVFGEVLDEFNPKFNETTGQPIEPEDTVMERTMEFSLAFIYIGVGAFVAALIQHSFWRVASNRQVNRMRRQYVDKLLRMDIAWFDQHDSTAVVTRLNSDLNLIEKALGQDLCMFIQFIFTFIFGFALGFWQGWQLSLFLLGIAPLLAAAGAIIMKVVASSQEAEQQAYGRAGSIASEVFGSIRTVLGLGAEPQMIERYQGAVKDSTRAEIKKGVFAGLGAGVTWAMFFFAYAAAFRFGFWLVHNTEGDGQYTGGKVMMVMFGVLIGAFALGQAGPAGQSVSQARASAWHIFDTIETVPTIDPGSERGLKPKKRSKGHVEFRKAVFSYPTRKDQSILSGVSFDVPAGQTVALVGESGCGKSTCLALLQRLYDADKGKVFLDGKDVRKYNVTWLRQQIGVVAQEPVVFAGTIRDNIALGAIQELEESTGSIADLLASVPEKSIIKAAKKAYCHDFIEQFPDGYNTYIGEAGAQLSGGQKQRIAIARAVLKNPPILLLDEATSALDSKSEKIVQQALTAASEGRTTIIIAHRLSTIRDADKIVAIEKGKAIESGTHDELLATKGSKYGALWAAQQGGVLDARASVDLRNTIDSTSIAEGPIEDSIVEASDAEEEDEEDEKLPPVPLARLVSLSKPDMFWIIVGCVGGIVNGAVMPSFALIFGEFIDLFYKPEDEVVDEVNMWTILFVAIGVATIIGQTAQSGAMGTSGAHLTERLRMMVVRSVLAQEVGWFDHKENEPNVLAEKLATQTTKIQGAVGQRFGMWVMNVVTVIYGLVLAFVNGWQLTLVVLGCLPIVSIGAAMEMKVNMGMSAKQGAALEGATASIAEAVQKIRTTFALTRDRLLVHQYNWALDDANPKATRYSFFAGIAGGVSQAGQIIIYGPIFIYGAYLVDEGVMEFKDVMIVFFAIVMMGMSLGQAASFAPDMAEVAKSTKNVLELIDREPLMDMHCTVDGDDDDFRWKGKKMLAFQKNGLDGGVTAKKASFAYPTRPEAPVLKGLSVSIAPGRVVAFVGSSGAGKSTIIAMVQRFYDPDEGSILLGSGKNSVDIRDLPARWVRQQLGVVGQEPVLFTGTIAENIRMGNPDLSDKDLKRACKDAQAHKFISSFPDGYNTEVGEKGLQLSGGQKQRIAIARAIARKPKILLLDEATSALDSRSEKEVQKTLNKLMQGLTTLVVAHRLSTIRDADEIIVMELGGVAERGTHDELMQKKGAYYTLVKRQQEH
jgi:ABC-type multidrug transport system fused ATPase/permease subunit